MNTISKTKIKEYIKASRGYQLRNALKMPDISGLRLGEARTFQATVLFVDIRGWTKLSQQISLDAQLTILHAYLGTASYIVKQAGGFLEKYTGDGVMCVFGSFDEASPPLSVRLALDSAQTILTSVRYSVNPVLNELKLPSVRCAAGLDFGSVALVHTGIRGENDMVTLGATANLASKIEGKTPEWKIGVGWEAHKLLWPDEWLHRWWNYKTVNDYKYCIMEI